MTKQKKLKRRIKISTKLEIVERLAHKSKGELRKLSGDACRLPGGGAKIIGEELHVALAEKILYERSAQRRVTRCMISMWAIDMKAYMNIDVSICASWVDRFMARAGFVLRKGTKKPVLEDRDIIEREALFVSEVRDIIAKFSIQPAMTYNLDETAVFFDHSKRTTVHPKGAKDVPVQSFGFEKQRVTAVFCASATGEKKFPCVMIKNTPTPDEAPVTVNNNVIELRMGTSWMNASSFIKYIKFLFPDPVAPNTILLIFDSARCHIAKDVKEYLTNKGILYAIIPGGMTGFCQPTDFGWFAQLKNQLSKSIDDWKCVGPHELTQGGRVKPPASHIVATWLTEAWAIVHQSTIQISFTRCVLGHGEELHLSRHERLGASFLRKLSELSGEQARAHSVQGILV